jgi:hypothetical protein
MRVLIAVLFVLLSVPLTATAQGYDPGAPCGRDENGVPYACTSVSPNMLEATCLTSASPYYCLPYHQRACQTGFQVACTVAQYGQHCNGGDPTACQYYVGILEANRACHLNGDQGACGWLMQQGF